MQVRNRKDDPLPWSTINRTERSSREDIGFLEIDSCTFRFPETYSSSLRLDLTYSTSVNSGTESRGGGRWVQSVPRVIAAPKVHL